MLLTAPLSLLACLRCNEIPVHFHPPRVGGVRVPSLLPNPPPRSIEMAVSVLDSSWFAPRLLFRSWTGGWLVGLFLEVEEPKKDSLTLLTAPCL